jgi:hypothetical protein
MKAAKSIRLAIFAVAISGCATVMNGKTEPLGLSSNPSGAQATIDGRETVVTPVSIDLARAQSHTIVFHKDGYDEVSATVVPESSGWIWGNILAGGIIGAAVDYSTGAAKKFSQDTVSVTMVPKSVVPTSAAIVTREPAPPVPTTLPQNPNTIEQPKGQGTPEIRGTQQL